MTAKQLYLKLAMTNKNKLTQIEKFLGVNGSSIYTSSKAVMEWLEDNFADKLVTK